MEGIQYAKKHLSHIYFAKKHLSYIYSAIKCQFPSLFTSLNYVFFVT